jgi:hypothetical protein
MPSQNDAPLISPQTLKLQLVAPCGINCGLCIAFQRRKDRCPGCGNLDGKTRATRTACALRRCETRKGRFCSTRCPTFPCVRLKRLDRRYRTRYGVSMLENLGAIEEYGLRAFVAAERERWPCMACGSLRCVHQGACAACGTRWRKPHGPDALRR